jgi:hypothetical protein
VAAAAGCLLNPERKAGYDRQLRQLDALRTQASQILTPEALSSEPSRPLQSTAAAAMPTITRAARQTGAWGPNATLVAAAIGVPVALALIVVVTLSLGGNTPNNQAAVVPSEDDLAPLPPAVSPETPPAEPLAPVVNRVTPSRLEHASPSGHPQITSPPEALPIEIDRAADVANSVDLLQGGKDELSIVRGYITRKGALIRTTTESTAFSLPAEFPEEYALEIDVIRQSGTNAICFGFTAFEQPLTAVIDGFYSTKSGLASINDREIFTEGNPQVRPGALLTNGKQSTIRIEVSKDAVRLAVDQAPIVDWPYDPQAKLRSAKGMHGGDLDRIHVFTWDSAYHITRLELLPAP